VLKNWKKLLFLFIIVGVIYMGCNTQGILATEKFFRVENPKLSITPKVCYLLGNAAFRSFRYQLAIDIIDRNLKDFPYERAAKNAKYRRAICYEKLGNYDMAIELYKEFLLEYPKDNRQKAILSKVAKLQALHKADEL
jgi:tetratricopeptide (TPR) repeat protein